MQQISGGHSVSIPNHDACSGVFTQTNAVSSWWDESWTPVLNANQATTTHYDWQEIGIGTVTSPDCVTDMTVTVNPGAWYVRLRRARIYSWLDYRIVVNGTVVYTLSNAAYSYIDERRDTNPDVIDPIPVDMGAIFHTIVGERLNIPAGATVSVEGRWRWNVNGSQTSAYARVIGGLRSQVKFDFTTRNILTGVS